MRWINCKVELKLKWTKYCIVSAGADIQMLILITLSSRDNQKLSKLLSKGFERSVYWNEYKTKSENKNLSDKYRYFLESNFFGANRLYVLVDTNEGGNAKRFNARKYFY